MSLSWLVPSNSSRVGGADEGEGQDARDELLTGVVVGEGFEKGSHGDT